MVPRLAANRSRFYVIGERIAGNWAARILSEDSPERAEEQMVAAIILDLRVVRARLDEMYDELAELEADVPDENLRDMIQLFREKWGERLR